MNENGTKFKFCSKKMFCYSCIFAVFWFLQLTVNLAVGPKKLFGWFFKYAQRSNTIDIFTLIGRKHSREIILYQTKMTPAINGCPPKKGEVDSWLIERP